MVRVYKFIQMTILYPQNLIKYGVLFLLIYVYKIYYYFSFFETIPPTLKSQTSEVLEYNIC